MHAKTIIFVAGVATGIVAGLMSPFASELAVAVLLLGVAQMIVYVFERKCEIEGFALSLFTALFSFAIFLGVVRAQLIEEKIPYTCEASCTFEGHLVSSPESKDAYQTFVIRPSMKEENVYDVEIRTALYPKYAIGEMVRVSGKVKEPDIMFPHGDEKSFDYVSYLHTKSVGSEILFPKIELLGTSEKSVVTTLGRWKENFVERINLYVSSPASSLASGMLFGNSSMSKELTDTFRIAGLSHIIVLSGFNIAIVIAFILFVFAFVPLVVRITLATISVILFVMMVGGEASVIRATLMSFVGLLAMILGREYVARQALMLSLLAIILYDPIALTESVSLHLSFLATAGIVYWSEAMKSLVAKLTAKIFFVELLVTTLAAYIATLPYVMHTFGTVSVYALLANVIVLPLVPLAMLFSFLTLLVSFMSHTLALLFGAADSFLINGILFAARTVSGLPGASFSLSISFATMCALYLFAVITIFYFSRRKEDETSYTTEQGFLADTIPY